MTTYDEACRYLAKLDGAGFLSWTLGPDAGLTFADWLDPRTTTDRADAGQRTGDLIAVGTEQGVGPFWAIAVEFQYEPDAEMPGRLLELLGRIYRSARPPGPPGDRFQLASAVLNLTGRGATAREMVAAQGRSVVRLKPVERNLEHEDAAATLEAIAAGRFGRCVLPWIPLMHGGDDAGIISRWKETAAAEPDAARRADYGQLARTLAGAAKRKEVWLAALEGWEVKESPYARELMDEGRAEGRVQTRAEVIVESLKLRFGEGLPEELAARVSQTRNLEQLTSWFTLAVTAPSLDAFRRAAGI